MSRALPRRAASALASLAALATLDSQGSTLRLRGRVVSLSGGRMVEGEDLRTVRSLEEAETLGVALAERLLGEGADFILTEARASVSPVVSEP